MSVRLLPARHGVRAVSSPRHAVELEERHAVRPVDRSSLFVAPSPAFLLLLLGGN